MRQILYKGQKLADKELVYGGVLQTEEGIKIVRETGAGCELVDVVPESVSMMIGRRDDGTKIFEDSLDVCPVTADAPTREAIRLGMCIPRGRLFDLDDGRSFGIVSWNTSIDFRNVLMIDASFEVHI